MDEDIAKLLRKAGIDPAKATDFQVAMADRLLTIHRGENQDSDPNWAKAIEGMRRYQ